VEDNADITVFPQLGHIEQISSIIYSPDGKYIISKDGKTSKLWDAGSGRELLTLKGGDKFSPDGKYIISATGRLYDVENGQKLKEFKVGFLPTTVAYNPDGKSASIGYYEGDIKIFDIESGQELRIFKGHTDPVNSLAFSPDGKYIVSGSGSSSSGRPKDSSVRMWNTETGQELWSRKGYTRVVHSIGFSPDGKRIFALLYNFFENGSDIRIYDTENGRELRTITERGSISDCVYSPDGKFFISSAGIIWDAESGKKLRTLPSIREIGPVACSPDGMYIAAGIGNEIVIYDFKSGRELFDFSQNVSVPIQVTYSPNGQTIATIGSSLILWTLPH
jgi:WD40 repeat protein